MPSLAAVEVNRDEADVLLQLVRGQHAELTRMLQNLDENDAGDLARFQVKREWGRRLEVLEDLTVKLEAALKETLEPRA